MSLKLFLRDCEAGLEFKINIPGITTVGRGGQNDIQPDSMSVSKTHAAFSVTTDLGQKEPFIKEIWIEDFNSRNGTFVGHPTEWEKVRGRHKLSIDECIKFGNAPKYYIVTDKALAVANEDEDNRSPNRVLNRSNGSAQGSVRPGELVKELLSPSEGVPFHAAPGDKSYPGPTYGQPRAQGQGQDDPFGLPFSLSASPGGRGPGGGFGFTGTGGGNPARYGDVDNSYNPLQNQPRPTQQEQQRPIRKLDETYESQLMLGRRDNTTQGSGGGPAGTGTGTGGWGASAVGGMTQLGAGGLNLALSGAPPNPTLQPPTYVGGVSQFPDQQRAAPSSFLTNRNPYPSYMQNGGGGGSGGPGSLQHLTNYGAANPPVNPQPMHFNSPAINNPNNPNNWMGHLHLVVQSPPADLPDFRIDQQTARSLGASDFGGLVRSKVRELAESVNSLRRFDPNVVPSRPLSDAVLEILSSSSPAADKPPLDVLAELSRKAERRVDQLDGDNELDGPPINLADGATVGLKQHPAEPFAGEKSGAAGAGATAAASRGANPIGNKPPPIKVGGSTAGVGAGAAAAEGDPSPHSVSEAVIFEGLAEAMLEQEQSTIALLTLVTAELKGLFDKLVAAALAQEAINSMNATAGMPNGSVCASGSVFGGGDEDDAAEVALGLRSIVGFILSANIERLRSVCKSTLLVSMQADSLARQQAKAQAATAGGLTANPNLPGAPAQAPGQAVAAPLSPSKAVHDTIMRVTTQLEALNAFVTRNNNAPAPQAWGGLQAPGLNPYQVNLSPEEVNQVIVHVLSDVVVTLNNILQQTARVMQDIEKITAAVENDPQSLASPTGAFTGASLKSFMRGERTVARMNVSANQGLLESLEKEGKGGKGGKGGKVDPVQKKLEEELEELRAYKEEQERARREHDFGVPGGGRNAPIKRVGSNTVADELALFERSNAPATPKGSRASPSLSGDGASSPRSALLQNKSPKSGAGRRVMSPREKQSRMLGVLRMMEDKALRVCNAAFKHWLKVCIESALKEERAANHAATVKRVIKLFGVRSLRDVAAAFRKWHEVTLATRGSGGGGGGNARENAELRMKLLDATNRLYEITSRDDRAAAYVAEKSFNRELSLINMELRRCIQELNLKLVELMPANGRAAAATGSSATQQQRNSIVQDVLVQREDELARCRRDYHELLEQLKQYESFYKVDQNALQVKRAGRHGKPFKSYGSNSNNSRGGRGYESGGGSDRSRSRSRSRPRDARSRSPQRQSAHHSDSGGEGSGGEARKKYRNRGRTGYEVTSKAKGGALKGMDYVCEHMSVKVARQVLVLEMKRLSEQLKEAGVESKELRKAMATEMSKNVQLSQAHHVLCDRLSMVENNQRVLTDALAEALGPDQCHAVLELAYSKGFNKHSEEFDQPEDSAADFPRAMNTRLNGAAAGRASAAGAAAGGGAKAKKKVDMSTQDDFGDY